MPAKAKSAPQKSAAPTPGAERRRTPRKDVLDTFQVFVAVKKKGLRKIYLRDVSEGGLGLHIEPDDGFKSAEVVECEFHINPGLKLPLKIRVAHLSPNFAGCEFVETSGQAYKAYKAFIAMLDQLAQFVD